MKYHYHARFFNIVTGEAARYKVNSAREAITLCEAMYNVALLSGLSKDQTIPYFGIIRKSYCPSVAHRCSEKTFHVSLHKVER